MSDVKTPIAADWFARERSGAMTADERAAFVAWLAANEQNRNEWAKLQVAWSMLGSAGESLQISELRKQALANAAPMRAHMQRLPMALAASVVLAFGAILLTLKESRVESVVTTPLPRFETTTGERSTYVLADGSRVIVNTDSAVHVSEWGMVRRVVIDRGQAYFVVAKNSAQPFVVEAGNATVTAVGTQFDVRRDARNVTVVLTEGRVHLSQSGTAQSVDMNAGSVATTGSSGTWQLHATNTATLTSWRDGRLIFEAEPLANVVAELNRYSKTQLSIADASLRTLPISGVFRTGDVNGFARALQAYGVASANTSTSIIELSAVK